MAYLFFFWFSPPSPLLPPPPLLPPSPPWLAMSRQRKFSPPLPGSLPSQLSAARPPAWLAPWMPSLWQQAPPPAAAGYSPRPTCRGPAPFSLPSPTCLTWAGNRHINKTSAVIHPSIRPSVCCLCVRNSYDHLSISFVPSTWMKHVNIYNLCNDLCSQQDYSWMFSEIVVMLFSASVSTLWWNWD